MRGFKAAIFIFAVMGCGGPIHEYPPAPKPEATPGPSRAERMSAMMLDFETVHKEVLLPKCGTNCHGADKFVNVHDYMSVAMSMAEIKSTALDRQGKVMPPIEKPQLTDCERRLLAEWIAAGGNEKSEKALGRLPECERE